MGLLSGTGLLKLQENFLTKGDQNGILPLKLARVILIAKYENLLIKSDKLASLISWAEDAEMKIGGIARKQFGQALKDMVHEPDKIFGQEKK